LARREKWIALQAKTEEARKAFVFGQPAPADRDARTIAERRLLEAHLAKRDD
jgi:hypothetical protein